MASAVLAMLVTLALSAEVAVQVVPAASSGAASAVPAMPEVAAPGVPAAATATAPSAGVHATAGRVQVPPDPRSISLPALPAPTQDPGVTRAKIHEILAQPQFRQAQPNLVERLGSILSRWIAAVMTGLESGGVGAVAAWAILATGVAALVLLARRLARDVRPDPSSTAVQTPGPSLRSPLEWRRLAEGHEGRGEWRPALRCHYRALVADLVACRAIRDLPGRTSGEYRSEIDASVPAGAVDFAAASELFERAWYGTSPTGPDENGRFRELAERVRDRAGTR